jgi:hypothetical protein
MKNQILSTAIIVAFLAAAPAGWSQLVPEINPKLAPTTNPKHQTSSESLAAQAQHLTKKISQAKAQGRNTGVAEAKRAEGERSMMQGNEKEAVRDFQAGERALEEDESERQNPTSH